MAGRLAGLAPRWRKVLRDLGQARARTALVVLSMAVGIFAIGTVAGTRQMVSRALTESFLAIQASNATITTFSTFDEAMVDTVGHLPAVAAAEGRRNLLVRMRGQDGEWRNMQLNVLASPEAMRLDRVLPHRGDWPPPHKGVVVERSALGLVGAAIGEDITIRTTRGKERQLRVAGTAFDVYALIFTLDGTPWGYIDEGTAAWLGEERGFNELHLRVAEGMEGPDEVASVVAQVRDKLERDGRAIYYMTLPEPGKHPLDSTIQAMMLLLGAMGGLALGLSAFLVTNTVAAIMAQETRAIGIMKAIGASRGQIGGIYAALVAAYGLLALLVAMPLGLAGTVLFSRFMAGYLNLDLTGMRPPANILALQAAVALLVPLVAAGLPLWQGTRTTVREALGSYGLGRGQFGTRRVDRALERLRGLSRPVLLGLRNTFRRTGRLALTVSTLAIAGAMFMGILHVRASLMRTLDVLLELWQYDVAVQLSKPYRSARLQEVALGVPGIQEAEGWGFTSARHTTATSQATSSMLSLSVPLIVFAPRAETAMLRAPILRGRWLLPADERAVVVSTAVLDDQPGLDVGGSIGLKMEGRDTTWTVVGVTQGIGPTPLVYVNYEPFARVVESAGEAQFLATKVAADDPAVHAEVAKALESALERSGISISAVIEVADERAQAEATFEGIIALLLVMVGLMAVVGGLGLTGTTSLNVIERRREIGVLRAIGAQDRSIYQVILVENVCIALLSWAIGLMVSLPLGAALSAGIGTAMLGSPLSFRPSGPGMALWLGIAFALVLLASWLPARRAVRTSVREALAYD